MNVTHDTMKDVYTVKLNDGRCVQFAGHPVRTYGIETLMHANGLSSHVPVKRVPLTYDGRVIGTLPETFHPLFAKSRSIMYDVRPGDFVRDAQGWTAHRSLGPGDIAAIEGFIPCV